MGKIPDNLHHHETPESAPNGRRVEVPGVGPCVLPDEFAIHTGTLGPIERRDARGSLVDIHARLAAGAAIVLHGPYAYVDAVFRYCQRFERALVSRSEVAQLADRARRRAAFTDARRRKLHHLFVVARGDQLLDVEDPPESAGLRDWLVEPPGDETFLMPLRRFQRILADMRRASEGIPLPGLADRITILPHVYVPSDQSVPAMLAACAHLIAGRRVLDVGTGTGILAVLAARLGAAHVVATDFSPHAVANARLNVERLGLQATVEVRGPADLFGDVGGETFDAVLFNAPWIEGQPRTPYDTGLYDPGYRVIDGFVRGVSDHLAPGGAVLLQYSDISRRGGRDGIQRLHDNLAAAGLHVVGEQSIRRVSRVSGGGERVFLFEIRPGGRKLEISRPRLRARIPKFETNPKSECSNGRNE